MEERTAALTRVRSAALALVPALQARIPTPRRSPEQNPDVDGQRWRRRPLLAALVKALTFLVPAGAAIAATALLSWGMHTPSSWRDRIGWWALLLAVSTVVATVVERQTRRLLPLTVLLKLTLLFPDEVPSRFRLARAAGHPGRLQELARGSSPRARAAAEVLLRVAELARHDRHTRGHSERVRVFTDLLAEQLGVSGADRDKLRWASLLHDIGKLEVPAGILNKPGKPTQEEWDVLRGHPATGVALLGPLAAWLGPWAGGVADHHERFDGTGYPAGLSGRSISLAGRIVAVADSFETMTAARAYKRPMAAAAGREELARCAGTHFDPDVVRAFLAIGLPRMLSSIGPLSFLLHFPFLGRLPEASMQLAAVAGQAALPVATGLTAATLVTTGAVVPAAADAGPPSGSAGGASAATAGGAGQVRDTTGTVPSPIVRPQPTGLLAATVSGGASVAHVRATVASSAHASPSSVGGPAASKSASTPPPFRDSGTASVTTEASQPAKPSTAGRSNAGRPATGSNSGSGSGTRGKSGSGNNGNHGTGNNGNGKGNGSAPSGSSASGSKTTASGPTSGSSAGSRGKSGR